MKTRRSSIKIDELHIYLHISLWFKYSRKIGSLICPDFWSAPILILDDQVKLSGKKIVKNFSPLEKKILFFSFLGNFRSFIDESFVVGETRKIWKVGRNQEKSWKIEKIRKTWKILNPDIILTFIHYPLLNCYYLL